MKFLVVLAIICAVIAAGCLLATCFVGGSELMLASVAGGLGLFAFILLMVAYTTKSKM